MYEVMIARCVCAVRFKPSFLPYLSTSNTGSVGADSSSCVRDRYKLCGHKLRDRKDVANSVRKEMRQTHCHANVLDINDSSGRAEVVSTSSFRTTGILVASHLGGAICLAVCGILLHRRQLWTDRERASTS